MRFPIAGQNLRRWLSMTIGIAVMAALLATGVPPSVLAARPTPTANVDAVCDMVLTRAISLTENYCAAVGRNEACYGYTVVHAELQPGEDPSKHRFVASGDILPVRLLASIRTESVDPVAGTWGMAVLKLQAELPDTNPGQNITFILFGDSQFGKEINRTNAFYLSTSLGPLACKQIPQDSLIVRAPGSLRVKFSINDVEFSLSSTLVLRAARDGELLASVLEGHVSVTAQGVTRHLVAGQQVKVPMRGLAAAGEPSQPAAAAPEPAIDALAPVLNALEPDKISGAVTLSGPIEAVNPSIPALTVLGRQVWLSKVTGWQNVQIGQWVRVEGDMSGLAIRAQRFSIDAPSFALGPAVRPADTPAPTQPPVQTGVTPPSTPEQPPATQVEATLAATPTHGPIERPTDIPTAAPTNAPTGDQTGKIDLHSLCSSEPERSRLWRVWNGTHETITFTWELENAAQSGAGSAAPLSHVLFTTVTVPGANVVRLYVGGALVDSAVGTSVPCTRDH